MEDRRCSGCTLSSLTLTSSPSLCSPVLVRCSRGGGGGFGCSLVGLHSFAAVCQTNQFWPPRLHVVWLLLFKWTSRLQTGHKWLRLIQTLIIEIPCKRLGHFKYVVSIFFRVSGEFFSFSFFFFLHLFVGQRLRVTRRITRLTPFWRCWCHWGWKSPCKSCYLAPVQGIGASAISIFSIYGHMLYFLRRRPNAPLLCCNCRLIFCVSELWIVVLPHCNKQMAARSWVITNPLREWLVLSRAALIRARWLSPVFAQALKSSSGFVTLGVCSG